MDQQLWPQRKITWPVLAAWLYFNVTYVVAKFARILFTYISITRLVVRLQLINSGVILIQEGCHNLLILANTNMTKSASFYRF